MTATTGKAAPEATQRTYQCGLCGCQFVWDPNAPQPVCSTCPLAMGCGLVMCPNCGYEFPGDSRVVGLLGRVWRWVSSRVGGHQDA